MNSFSDTIRELVELIRTYAKQELVDPLRGLPLYLGFGLAGAIACVLGAGLVLLGVLRALQTELIEGKASDGTSVAPYFIVTAVAAVLIVILARRINRQFGRPA